MRRAAGREHRPRGAFGSRVPAALHFAGLPAPGIGDLQGLTHPSPRPDATARLHRRGMFVAIHSRKRSRRTRMATVLDPNPAGRKSLAATLQAARNSTPFTISTREPSAIAFWCRHFNVSPERLLAAVRKVGSNPDIVRLELRAFQSAACKNEKTGARPVSVTRTWSG
jgi:hypothetical protein